MATAVISKYRQATASRGSHIEVKWADHKKGDKTLRVPYHDLEGNEEERHREAFKMWAKKALPMSTTWAQGSSAAYHVFVRVCNGPTPDGSEVCVL